MLISSKQGGTALISLFINSFLFPDMNLSIIKDGNPQRRDKFLEDIN